MAGSALSWSRSRACLLVLLAGAQRQQPAGAPIGSAGALVRQPGCGRATGPAGPAVGRLRGWRCWPGRRRAGRGRHQRQQPAGAPIVPAGALVRQPGCGRTTGPAGPAVGTSRRWRCWRAGAEPVEGVPAGPLLAGAELCKVEGLPPGAGGRRPAPAAGRSGADRAGRCAGCRGLASAPPRGRQARPVEGAQYRHLFAGLDRHHANYSEQMRTSVLV